MPLHQEYRHEPRAMAVDTFDVPPEIGGHKPTPPDILGPFWLPDSPVRTDVRDGIEGPFLTLAGKVRSSKNGDAVPGAILEFWQANRRGQYDEHGPKHRGQQVSNAKGEYRLDSFVPGDYDISDPSVPEPHEFRCAHIHVRIAAHGFAALVTQLYFPDDEYNAKDRWYDARRVIDRTAALFDFYLKPNPHP